MINTICIEDVLLSSFILEIGYYGSDISCSYMWIENVNKHLPNIYLLECDSFRNKIFLTGKKIAQIIDLLKQGNKLKLCISDEEKLLMYSISNTIILNNKLNFDIVLQIANSKLTFFSPSAIKDRQRKQASCLRNKSICTFLNNRVEPETFHKSTFDDSPVKIIVIGTCFSRSVFKSEQYFNPDYKRYFSIIHTVFHNSMISLMSKTIDDSSYLHIDDLVKEGVFNYIEIEFTKKLMSVIHNCDPDYIFLDNYIDATTPVIRMGDIQFVTYNKYFSESIYKRRFSDCEIISPDTEMHHNLYKAAIKLFVQELKKINKDTRLILLGGRLSRKIYDASCNECHLWDCEKQNWIINSNNNWDVVDGLFLHEAPSTKYIDMRNTSWVSDSNTPIIGGASPSHYQSGYYKEIYEKLKEIIFY